MRRGVKGRPGVRGRPRSFDQDLALEAAMQVIWRKGYDRTSLADLTKAMGINPPSLYAAFGDKEQLFMTAIGRYLHILAKGWKVLDREPTARGAIDGLLDWTVRLMTRRNCPAGCMLMLSATEAELPKLVSELASLRAGGEARLRQRIELGIERREMPATSDAASLAKFYVTVIQGMSIQARDGVSRRKLLEVKNAAMCAWPI